MTGERHVLAGDWLEKPRLLAQKRKSKTNRGEKRGHDHRQHERQWLADIKTISDRCKLEMGIMIFQWTLFDCGSWMARNVIKTHIEELCTAAGQGAKGLWGKVTRPLWLSYRWAVAVWDARFPPARPWSWGWTCAPGKSPLSCPSGSSSSLLCVCVCAKKHHHPAGTVITSKDIAWMRSLWHALVSHLALGAIHLHLNLPVLSVAYCNMFMSLGSIIVIVDRQRRISTKTLIMRWSGNFHDPGIPSQNVSFPTDSRSGGILSHRSAFQLFGILIFHMGAPVFFVNGTARWQNYRYRILSVTKNNTGTGWVCIPS